MTTSISTGEDMKCKITFTSPFSMIIEDSLNGTWEQTGVPKLDKSLEEEGDIRIYWEEVQICYQDGKLSDVMMGGFEKKDYGLWSDDVEWEGLHWLTYLEETFFKFL